jgi:hypothetical protein
MVLIDSFLNATSTIRFLDPDAPSSTARQGSVAVTGLEARKGYNVCKLLVSLTIDPSKGPETHTVRLLMH